MPLLGKLSEDRFTRSSEGRRLATLGEPSRQAQQDALKHLGDDARVCGAPGCAKSWIKPWRKKNRPVFEGEWGCSRRCLEEIVRGSVRREVGGDGSNGGDARHAHRVPLGLVLLAQGWITHPQLQTALDAQRASGHGRIGDWLAKSCGLEEQLITRGLGVQWSCPVLRTEGFSPAAMALVMPKRFIVEFGLVPLRVGGSQVLYVASEERMNAAVAFGLERMSGLRVECGLVDSSRFAQAKTALLEADGVPLQVANVKDADMLAGEAVRLLEEKQPTAARLVRIHGYYWLRLWLESGAFSNVGTIPSGTEDMADFLFSIGDADAA